MHRIDSDGAVASRFVGPDAGTGQPGTVIDPAWLNSVQEEIAGVVEASGLTLTKANTAQLAAALAPTPGAITAGGGVWSASAESGQVPTARKFYGGRVALSGKMLCSYASGFSWDSLVGTLAAAYRPQARRACAVAIFKADGTFWELAGVEVGADGSLTLRRTPSYASIEPPIPPNCWVDLSGVAFVI